MAIGEELSFEAGQTKLGCVAETRPENQVARDAVKSVLLLSAAREGPELHHDATLPPTP